MKNKPVQYFSSERLKKDAKLPKEEIVRFLHEFQMMAHGDEGARKLISLRVPERLMHLFKEKASREGVRYQTQIVALMRDWLK